MGKPTLAVDLRALVPEPTGIGVYTERLLEALAERGTFELLGLAHKPPTHADQLTAAGVALEDQSSPLGVLWQQVRLPLRLRRGDVDLVWSPILTLPRWCPVPAVATVHDLTAIHVPAAHTAKVRWSLRPFLRSTLRQARFVVTLSQAAAEDLKAFERSCADRLRVVPPGVEPAFAPAPPARIATMRNSLGAPEGYWLFAGTLEPRKNVGALVDAWLDLRQRRPDVPPLVIAGGAGWGSDPLAQRIASLRDQGLHHVGRVPRARLVELFQGASLFVFPSLYEGFGLPPLEAMACAVPVVTTDRSSLPEVVGEAGVLFDPDKPNALTEALEGLLDDPRRAAALGEAGQRRAQAFTWQKTAEGMERIFLEALD
ncbi:MAG: glycosyltransferase family 1 protein [Acidobacteriota bacterium]